MPNIWNGDLRTDHWADQAEAIHREPVLPTQTASCCSVRCNSPAAGRFSIVWQVVSNPSFSAWSWVCSVVR